MIRYGKPIKNKKRSDPRYFLYENLNEQEGRKVVTLELTGPYQELMDELMFGHDLQSMIHKILFNMRREFENVGFVYTGEGQGGPQMRTAAEKGFTPAFGFEEQPNADYRGFESLQGQAVDQIRRALSDPSDVVQLLQGRKDLLDQALAAFSQVGLEGAEHY